MTTSLKASNALVSAVDFYAAALQEQVALVVELRKHSDLLAQQVKRTSIAADAGLQFFTLVEILAASESEIPHVEFEKQLRAALESYRKATDGTRS